MASLRDSILYGINDRAWRFGLHAGSGSMAGKLKSVFALLCPFRAASKAAVSRIAAVGFTHPSGPGAHVPRLFCVPSGFKNDEFHGFSLS